MKRKVDFRLARAFLMPSSILSAARCLLVCKEPLSLLYHYITRNPLPNKPTAFRFRTPTGEIALNAFSAEDVITFFIVFCRKEYSPYHHARVFVDFGSNIGVTAAYFLSRDERNIVHCYEPNPVNIGRLKDNLQFFEDRYSLGEVCVGLENGLVPFGAEKTGVYGAIGAEHEGGSTFRAQCRKANEILAEIASRHSTIDFLKIDVEGLEQDIIKTLEPELLGSIQQIQAEIPVDFDHQLPGFRRSRFGPIVRFDRLPRDMA